MSESARPALRGVARGSSLGLAGYVASAALGFVFIALVTRSLGVHMSGAFFGAMALLTIAAQVTELGADTGAVRTVARFRSQGRFADIPPAIAVAVIPATIASTAAALAIGLGADAIAGVVARDDPAAAAAFLRAMSPFLPAATAATVLLAATRGFATMRPFVAIDLVAKPLAKPLLLLALAAAGGLATWEVAVAWGAPEAVAAAAASAWLLRLVRSLGPGSRSAGTKRRSELAREFWAFAAPRGLAAAFQVCVSYADVLLLGAFVPLRQVAVYAAASRLASVAAFGLSATRLAIAPQIAALLARGDRPGAQTVFHTATSWLTLISWPLFLLMATFAPVLLSVFGPGFEEGAAALAMVSAAMLVNVATGNVTVVLLMGGKSRWNLLNTGIALALNVGLNLLLIPRLGIEGAAIAWSASIVTENVLATWEVRRLLSLSPFGEGSLPAMAIPLAMVGLPCIAARLFFGPTLAGLSAAVLVATPLFLLAARRSRDRLALDTFRDSLAPAGSRSRVARAGRGALRGWGILTSGLRAAPDFMGIGTKRGGTTSLASALFAHPNVAPLYPSRLNPKGVRYLDENHDEGDRWYRSHFATVLTRGTASHPRRLAGEVVADYLFHPLAAERAAAAAPEARMLVVLRDPADRAWSHWRERTRHGAETLGFADALDAEAGRLDGELDRILADPSYRSLPRDQFAYVAQGRYAELLEPWIERFGRERMAILIFEELFADPAAAYGGICDFLGLPRHELDGFPRENQAPSAERMPNDVRAELDSSFEADRIELERLLGRELPWGTGRAASLAAGAA